MATFQVIAAHEDPQGMVCIRIQNCYNKAIQSTVVTKCEILVFWRKLVDREASQTPQISRLIGKKFRVAKAYSEKRTFAYYIGQRKNSYYGK